MADRIQQRRDTKARWEQFNPVLLEGEVGYVLDDVNRYKIGDGVHTWNQLPFRGFDGTIVHDTGNSENAVMSQKAVSDNHFGVEGKVDGANTTIEGVIKWEQGGINEEGIPIKDDVCIRTGFIPIDDDIIISFNRTFLDSPVHCYIFVYDQYYELVKTITRTSDFILIDCQGGKYVRLATFSDVNITPKNAVDINLCIYQGVKLDNPNFFTDVEWDVNGMDYGYVNKDENAIHTKFLYQVDENKVIAVRLPEKNPKWGAVIQCYDSQKEFLRFHIKTGIKTSIFTVEDDVKYVRIVAFSEDGIPSQGFIPELYGVTLDPDKEQMLVGSNLKWNVGGMDDGMPNVDMTAIHTDSLLKINGNVSYCRTKGFGCVIQWYDEYKNFISYWMEEIGTIWTPEVPDNARYCRFVIFNPKLLSNNIEQIKEIALSIRGVELTDEVFGDITYTFTTKARSYSGKTITLWERKGEGTLTHMQFIGAVNSTISSLPEWWKGFYRCTLNVYADEELCLSGKMYELCGMGSDDYDYTSFKDVVFNSELFAKQGLFSGLHFKFRIPHYESIKVELVRDDVDAFAGMTTWITIKDISKVNLKFKNFELPYGSRFKSNRVVQTLNVGEEIELMSENNGGVFIGANFFCNGEKFNWVENCIRMYMADKIVYLSSGFEDYLGGAFGYNVGVKQTPEYGVTYQRMEKVYDGIPNAEFKLCGYRNHMDDPIYFPKGNVKITGRNGDCNGNPQKPLPDATAGDGDGNGLCKYGAIAFWYTTPNSNLSRK